jgi:hypothetical protein
MDPQYIPFLIIGLLTFFGLLCLLMDSILDTHEELEDFESHYSDTTVYSHIKTETKETEEDYADVLLSEDYDFLNDDIDSLT